VRLESLNWRLAAACDTRVGRQRGLDMHVAKNKATHHNAVNATSDPVTEETGQTGIAALERPPCCGIDQIHLKPLCVRLDAPFDGMALNRQAVGVPVPPPLKICLRYSRAPSGNGKLLSDHRIQYSCGTEPLDFTSSLLLPAAQPSLPG
jgi:hypothetical protein